MKKNGINILTKKLHTTINNNNNYKNNVVSIKKKWKNGMGFAKINDNYNQPSIMEMKYPNFLEYKKVSIIGVPFHAGQPKDGVQYGAKHLRNANLIQNLQNLGWDTYDYGDLEFPMLKSANFSSSYELLITQEEEEFKKYDKKNPKNCSIVGNSLEIIYNSTLNEHLKKNFVLSLGGDHSIGASTVLSALTVRPETGIIWVDAHADLNTPNTSNTGNMHGMPLAIAMNLFDRENLNSNYSWLKDKPILDPKQIVYIGLRDLDDGEKKFIRNLGIKAFTMYDIDTMGIGNVMKSTFDHLKLSNGKQRPLHLSYDVDACDPTVASSTGTLVRGGLSYREAHYIAESVALTGQLGSMDLVEVNSSINPKSYDDIQVDETVQLGVALVSSAMGSRIL